MVGGWVSNPRMNDCDLLKGISDSTIIYLAPALRRAHSYLLSPGQPGKGGLWPYFVGEETDSERLVTQPVVTQPARAETG